MTSSSRSLFRPAAVVLIAALILLIALPSQWKTWAPGFLQRPALHLGLDLVGGTQLDFRISEEEIRNQLAQLESEIAEAEARGNAEQVSLLQFQRQSIVEQQGNLVEAIRTVIERRINALGVSEATITPSYVGNEKHLLVECPGVVDTQECIKVVGKTIQLEFKEEFTEPTDEFIRSVRERAASAMARITRSGASLQAVGQDLGTQLGTAFSDRQLLFRDQLGTGMQDAWTLQPGRVVQREVTFPAPPAQPGQQTPPEPIRGIILVEALGPRTQTGRVLTDAAQAFTLLAREEQNARYSHHEKQTLNESIASNLAAALRSMQPGELKATSLDATSANVLFLGSRTPSQEQVEASHILVSYKGASAAEPNVTRTKEEAFARVQELKKRLDAGEDFQTLARNESDGSSRNQGGKLGTFGRGEMVPAFEQVAFGQTPGQVSIPVETQFGYHLIRTDSTITRTAEIADYDELRITGEDALARAEQIVTRLKTGEVRSQEEAVPLRTLFFSFMPTGWKDTTLDGKHFRVAAVTVDPVTNAPVVQITFDAEGGRLFQELTRRNIGKRIAIFVGGENVTSPVVQSEITGGTAVITGSSTFEEARLLAQDLNTGAIPAPIHLVGQYTVEATLGTAALRTSLMAAFIGTIILMLYMLLVYRLLGLMADIALFIYAVLLFALLKMPLFVFSSTHIVLTLAGMAGIILSIGMAVDANVLVFERMKEELRKGKLVKSAVESSFKFAWPAIRDGNVAALITCAILFLVGTSIVKGFAITLGLGVFLSLFTAVVITRWLLRKVASSRLAENRWLFGVSKTIV